MYILQVIIIYKHTICIHIYIYHYVYVYKLHYTSTIYIIYVYIIDIIYTYFINVYCAKIPGCCKRFLCGWFLLTHNHIPIEWRCLRMWGSLPINSPGCTDNVRKVLHPFLLCQGPHDAHHAALIMACQIQIDLSATTNSGIWWNSRRQVTHQLSSHSKTM
jgi:hypothetical protein